MTLPDIDNPIIEAGGWTSFLASITLYTINALDIQEITPYITASTGILGGIFLISKILHSRIQRKKDKAILEYQRMENIILKRQLEDNERKKSDN